MDEHAHDAEASTISDAITHALHHSWFVDPQTITVTEAGGKVRLSGSVGSPHDRRRPAVAAWSQPGVTKVDNDVQVI